MAKGEDTRVALMRAAEELFSKRGVAAVSLREVSAQAGQRNVSAVFYHFNTKIELLECVLERHSDSMQRRFSEQLALWEGDSSITTHHLIEMLVDALAQKLDDADGGRPYLLLCAQLCASPDFPLTERRAAQAPGALALTNKLLSLGVPFDPQLFPLRMMRFANTLYLSFADYIRLTTLGLAPTRDLFLRELIDALIDIVQPRRDR